LLLELAAGIFNWNMLLWSATADSKYTVSLYSGTTYCGRFLIRWKYYYQNLLSTSMLVNNDKK